MNCLYMITYLTNKMALIPFSYNNPYTDTLRLSERLFDIHHPCSQQQPGSNEATEMTTTTLRIKQDYKEDGKGGTKLGFGASVYNSAVALAKYLEQNPYVDDIIGDYYTLQQAGKLRYTQVFSSRQTSAGVRCWSGYDFHRSQSIRSVDSHCHRRR
eukprot:gb/GECG01008041.1/.p1 GENE.gb/GECG01008041.1/~~gb/GECG01008041.1/.p1  ORF type:complete len:156 (+),score=5.66 gb/GECG01008041.1/:1-468(+)